MPRVFYSWQSDAKPNRGFVRTALDDAVAQLAGDTALDEAQRDVEIDQDTQGLPGTPAIVDAILEKIRTADIFVADLTFIGGGPDGRQTPNPNALLEYGYALHALGDSRVVAVFNDKYGHPRDLPFDLAHRRWPIRFAVAADDKDRVIARKTLAGQLADAMRSILAQFGSDETEPLSPLDAFPAAEPGDGIGRLRRPHDYLCVPQQGGPIVLATGPYAYFRLIPSRALRPLGDVEAFEIAQRHLDPLSGARGGKGSTCRHDTGPVSYWADNDTPNVAVEASELFLSGEMWANSTYILAPNAERATEVGFAFIPTGAFEECLIDTLINFSSIARDHLKLALPVELRMGIVSVGDYRLAVDPNYFAYSGFEGRILTAVVKYETTLDNWSFDPFDLLEPFFADIYDKAGIRRPSVRTSGRRQR